MKRYNNEITNNLVQKLYHDEEGNPVVLTPGQLEIFDIIAGRLYPRSWVGTYTQYGKSYTVGLATLTRVSHYPEKWTIVAPKTEQAKIIMGYIIDHVFDNEMIAKKFEIPPGESSERIRRERSKNRLTFRMADGSIGGVQILSAQGKSKKNILDAVMGFGSPNVILDESSLLGDDHFAGIIRMLGGYKDNFLMQIGNPFYRNHFFKASKNPAYHKVRIDWRQGIDEGRITEEFIDEVRDEMRPDIFRVLYDVRFPDAESADKDGYMPLMTTQDIDRAYVDEAPMVGEPRMAIDVAGGGRNSTVAVVRTVSGAKVVYRTRESDHMLVGPKLVQYAEKYKVKPRNVAIDNVGIGHGLWNFLQQQLGKDVKGIKGGEKVDPDASLRGLEFENMRALMYWRCAAWLKAGGKLQRDSGFDELEGVRYIVKESKRIALKTKEDMLADDGIESPDTADALAMTFAWPEEPDRKEYKPKPYTPMTPYEGGDRRPEKRSGKVDVNDKRFGRYAQNW